MDVIRKLKIKIVFMMATLITILLVILLAAVYILVEKKSYSNSEELLDFAKDMIVMNAYASPDKINGGSQTMIPPIPEEIKDGSYANDGDKDFTQYYKVMSKYKKHIVQTIGRVITLVYDENGIIIRVDAPTGQVSFDSFLNTSKRNLIGKISGPGRVKVSGVPYIYKDVKLEDYGVIALVSRIEDTNTLESLVSILCLVGVVAFCVIFCISVLVAAKIVRPVENAWDRQKNFIADASHELKTPLTVISANIDVIRANPEDKIETQSKWFGYIDAEISDMQKLINDMLVLAKYDSKVDTDILSRVNLSDVVEEAGLVSESRAIEAGIEMDFRITDDIYIKGEERRLKQVVMILLDNALKNTPQGGRIILSLARMKNEAVIVCHNTGEGIVQKDLKSIFNRFYRADASRTRQSGGSGLGLAIAKSIVDSHRGKIYAESDGKTFAKFVVRLPISKRI